MSNRAEAPVFRRRGWRFTTAANLGTLAYAAFCLGNPDHLPKGAGREPNDGWRTVAYVFAARDSVLSGLTLALPARHLPLLVGLRIAADAGDSAICAKQAAPGSKLKAAGVAAGWGALNAAAYTADRRVRGLASLAR